MTDEKRLSELKFDLRKQVSDRMKDKNMNTYSFDVARSTVSSICRHGDGQIQSLLSMVEDMGGKIIIVDNE